MTGRTAIRSRDLGMFVSNVGCWRQIGRAVSIAKHLKFLRLFVREKDFLVHDTRLARVVVRDVLSLVIQAFARPIGGSRDRALPGRALRLCH